MNQMLADSARIVSGGCLSTNMCVCCRVCVDMASLLVPGEGLLVGSFARALFLVHSECAESAYINSRPFRVNAGPVNALQCGRLRSWLCITDLHSQACQEHNTQRLSQAHAKRRALLYEQCREIRASHIVPMLSAMSACCAVLGGSQNHMRVTQKEVSRCSAGACIFGCAWREDSISVGAEIRLRGACGGPSWPPEDCCGGQNQSGAEAPGESFL